MESFHNTLRNDGHNTPIVSRAAQVVSGAISPRHRPAGPHLGVRTATITSLAFPPPIRAKAEKFKTGINNSGLNIDSQGNVWVTNRFGTGLLGMAHLVDMAVRLKTRGCRLRLPTT